MNPINSNSFNKNRPNPVDRARKFIKKIKRERGIYAVAHFDLPGSTKRMIRDQQGTVTEMIIHNKICRNLVEENGGVVIKELGDAILATFDNAPFACQSALNVIHNFKKYGKGMRTKVTITAGTIEKISTTKEPDIYGVPVNMCNRMSKFASVDSILIEEDRFQDIQGWLPNDKKIKYHKPKQEKLADFGPRNLRKIALDC